MEPSDVGRATEHGLSGDPVVRLLDGPAGAYVHVPFCAWICPFCPYNKVRASVPLATRYGAALEREVAGVAASHVRRFGAPMTSLYVGGGTPTLYPDLLASVLDRIPTTGERAVEVLPLHGTPEGYEQLAAIGFTAVSVGAQSFDDGVLRHLGRPHDASASRRAVSEAVERFACVDVDLIVDVALERPGPDAVARPGTFLADVEECFDAGVDQVSTYPLMRFGYTPFGRSGHERRREHEVLAEVTALARRMGYERRSVWTFNRRGRATYTSITRRRFVGMGAGATSATGRDFLVNHFGVGTYCAAVEAGRLPAARRLHLGRWAGAAYETFWQAYAGGVSPAVLAESYGRGVGTVATAALAPARLSGLVRPATDGALHLTARGFDVYHDLERAVTYRLIEPLWAEMLREHLAEGADVTPSCCPGGDPANATGLARTDPTGRPRSTSHTDAGADHAPSVRVGRRFWADPGQARRSAAWVLARRLMERPAASAEHDGEPSPGVHARMTPSSGTGPRPRHSTSPRPSASPRPRPNAEPRPLEASALPPTGSSEEER